MPNNLVLTITLSGIAGGAVAAFGSLKKSLDKCKQATALLNTENKKLGTSIQQAITNKSPASYIAHMTREYEKQKKVIEALKYKTQQLARVQSFVDTQKAKRAELRGQIMETAGLAYLVSRPLSVGIEFEASMSKVQSLTRLGKDSPEMQALTEQARKLGATTSFTASEAAQAQGFLAMAGFKPDAILKSMPSMLDLARAGGIELQRTADIASNIQTAFGLDASQMTRIADTLTMAFTTSNVDMEMLSESMKYAATSAKGLNISLEDTAAMIGMLGNAGIQGSMAGTTLRNAFNQLSEPSGAAAKALNKLKITTKDAHGHLRPMPEILYEISKATEGMGTAVRLGYAKNIFGARATPGLLSLLDNAEKIKPYIDIVTNSQGAAAKTASIMADNVRGDLIAVKSAWEDLSISIMDTEKGALRDLLQSVTWVLRKVSSWAQENKKFVGTVLHIVVGLVSFKLGLLGIRYAVSLILTPFVQFYGFAVKLLNPSLLLKSATALKSVGAAFKFIGRALLANPIILIIAGIAVAVFLIYKYWEPIKGFFIDLWQKICDTFSSVIDSVSTFILNWSPLEMFSEAFAGVMNWFGFELPANFTEFGAKIINGLIDGITGKWKTAKESFSNLGADINRMLKNSPAPSVTGL